MLRWVLAGALAVVGFGLAPVPAEAHQSGCHAAYSCPSDRHTYVWVDPQTGERLDCVSATNYPTYGTGQETVHFDWYENNVRIDRYHCTVVGGTPALAEPIVDEDRLA